MQFRLVFGLFDRIEQTLKDLLGTRLNLDVSDLLALNEQEFA